MMNLLFSPDGRISSAEFIRGALILIVITIAVSLVGLVSMGLSKILGFALFVFYWSWVVLWVKRFHDGGKSGWMCLIPILVYTVLICIAVFMIIGMIAADMAGGKQDFLAVMEALTEAGPEFERKMIIPGAIMGTVVSGIVAFGGNMLIKHDPQENQYGLGSATGDIFD